MQAQLGSSQRVANVGFWVDGLLLFRNRVLRNAFQRPAKSANKKGQANTPLSWPFVPAGHVLRSMENRKG